MFVNQTFDTESHVAILKLNRPDRLNSLTPEMVTEMCMALEEVSHRSDLYSLIISGEGKAFCAGSDLSVRLQNKLIPSGLDGDPYLLLVRKMNGLIENLPKPVIAAINGHAIGAGLELALACDLRVAAKSAKIGLTEAKVGAIPGGGGTQRLPRLIGMGFAFEMLFTGDRIDGERAEQIGLVNRAVDMEIVMDTALELAKLIACNAPLSLQAIKQAVRKGVMLDLEQALDLEMRYANQISHTEDRAEGMRAFLEKRKAVFTGK